MSHSYSVPHHLSHGLLWSRVSCCNWKIEFCTLTKAISFSLSKEGTIVALANLSQRWIFSNDSISSSFQSLKNDKMTKYLQQA